MSNPEDDWAAFEAAGGADGAEHADDGFGDFGDFGDFPDEEAKEEDKTNVPNPPKAEKHHNTAPKSTEQPKDESLDDIDKELQDFMNESDSVSIEKHSKSGKDSVVASSAANDKELEDFINEDSVDNVKMVFTPDGTPEQKEANTQAEP
jgi:nitrate reductase NapAB chaperone NapD